jgi:hypothetical protein
MPKKSQNQIVCEFFSWNLFRRDGVFYADARMNSPKLCKHSLGNYPLASVSHCCFNKRRIAHPS